VLGIVVGVARLVALGALAERISRCIEAGDRIVLGQISVAGERDGQGRILAALRAHRAAWRTAGRPGKALVPSAARQPPHA
jgi:hypothetical protein